MLPFWNSSLVLRLDSTGTSPECRQTFGLSTTTHLLNLNRQTKVCRTIERECRHEPVSLITSLSLNHRLVSWFGLCAEALGTSAAAARSAVLRAAQQARRIRESHGNDP